MARGAASRRRQGGRLAAGGVVAVVAALAALALAWPDGTKPAPDRSSQPSAGAGIRPSAGADRAGIRPAAGADRAETRPAAPPPQSAVGYPVPQTPPDRPLSPPSVFVSPSGDDTAHCSSAAPCRSFDRAYRAASPGDVVELAAGRYPVQVLYRDPTKTPTQAVEFVPAEGADVEVAYIGLGKYINDRAADHVAFRDMTIGGLITWRNTGLVLRDVTMKGTFYLQGSRNVSIIGGSVGGTDDGSHPDIVTWTSQSSPDPPVTPRNILIDGVRFHDMQMGRPGDHMSCMQVQNAIGIVLRNSRFHNCDTFDTRWDAVRNALVENNVFEPAKRHYGTATYYALSLREGVNVTIRNNTSPQPWSGPRNAEAHPTVKNFTVANNVFGLNYFCDERVTFRHNVWLEGSEPCDVTDRSLRTAADLGLTDLAGGDYRPAPGSRLLDAGWADGFPATDNAGRPRPQGAAPDIGAFEG
jgi:hypothetical protein